MSFITATRIPGNIPGNPPKFRSQKLGGGGELSWLPKLLRPLFERVNEGMDRYGQRRGACNKCLTCQEYVAPDGYGVRCARCECKPVDHENLSPHLASSSACYCSSQCQYPGCHQSVDFDPNSGTEYKFCLTHSDSTAMECLPVSVSPSQLEEEEEAPLSVPVLQTVTQVPPAAPLLPPAPHTIPSSLTTNTCALPECDNPRYVDPSTGKVHECCGYTHAMEHQRRLNLQQSMVYQNESTLTIV